MEETINNSYIIKNQIGKGMFGNVYAGINKRKGEPIAIKMEYTNSSIKLLKKETTILNYLHSNGARGIPLVIWYGIYKDNVCLVMNLFQCSLYDYKKTRELSEETIDYIIYQSIDILENIHKHYVIHRDIKPQNLMIKDGELNMIDFGFATFFVDDKREHKIQTTDNTNIIGTPKYISINIHNGIEPSRRDDLISVAYMLIYLTYGELEWDYIPICDNPHNYNEINILHYKNQERKRLKCIETIETRFSGKLLSFLKYCYGLNYYENPSYEYMKNCFVKTI